MEKQVAEGVRQLMTDRVTLENRFLVAGPTSGKTTWKASLFAQAISVVESDDIARVIEPAWDQQHLQVKLSNAVKLDIEKEVGRVVKCILGKRRETVVLSNLWSTPTTSILAIGRKLELGVFRTDPQDVLDLIVARNRGKPTGVTLSMTTHWVESWTKYAPRTFETVVWLKKGEFLSDAVVVSKPDPIDLSLYGLKARSGGGR